MIHELIVRPEMSAQETRKVARKLAMTGGFEVALAEELSTEELERLFEIWLAEFDGYNMGSAAQEASLAGRIMKLLATHPSLSSSLRDRIDKTTGEASQWGEHTG